ncbi:phosphotransferase [Spirosoma arcticum]
MLLTGFNIAHYLLDKGYLAHESILDGTFTAHQTSSRNANYLINRDVLATDSSGNKHDALFVKQVQAWDQEKITTLRTEATCYWLANNEAAYAQLKTFLPRFVEFDHPNHILITEAVPGAVNLHDFYVQQRQFPPALATRQAELLSSFHQPITTDEQKAPSLRLFGRQQPMMFIWSASGFPSYGAQRSEAERQMVQLITQNGDYMQRMQAVREQWQTTSLIHGDIKPANFLINADALQTNRYDLRLIDWETADIGDPCWDVAAVFQSYLFYWVLHEPFNGQATPEDWRSYGFPLEATQPSMRQFWQVYTKRMSWSADEIRKNLQKTVGYCALKLIHTCYESIQQAPVMPPYSARMLQLSLNMLRSPDDAIGQVLGL